MIEIEGITFAYDGNDVLQDISFKIEKGEKVILLGVNGSGKSTLLKLLDGLIFPKSGRYAYQNTKITKKQLKESTFSADFRSKVVLLFQNPDVMIFNPTVYDEISFGLKQLNRDHIDERVNFWADKLGITPYLKKPPFHLSSGEKQKVCLASLLVLEPELLLLDEPASNLDPLATGWLVDFLGELEETVIITTHNLSLSTELGKRSLVLSRDHRLIYDGDLKDFLTDADKLIEAHLMHTHKHKHGQRYHKHFHIHDWD